MKSRIKQEKGITLVALIITIVILIILAAVTISSVMHDGFIDVAINATQNYASEQYREVDEMSKLADKLNDAMNKINNNDQDKEYESGLYDANDNMLASWSDLVAIYGLNVEKDYKINTDFEEQNVNNIIKTYSIKNSSMLAYILENNTKLSNGIRLIVDSSITNIGENSFRYCNNLKIIKIPDNITNIANGVFYNCNNLSDINIPEGITSIGGGAFKYCSNLRNINIPEGVTSIGDSAFFYCNNLSSVNIPSKVKRIGESAFLGCERLKSIAIPDGVMSIEEATFYGCKSLSGISIPEGITSISFGAFLGCESLEQINLPSSVAEIKMNAFEGCKSLKNIVIPSGVTTIDDGVFYGCSNLKSIKIPKSVTEIWELAGMPSLTDIYYEGTEEQWNAITLVGTSIAETDVTIHYNSTF